MPHPRPREIRWFVLALIVLIARNTRVAADSPSPSTAMAVPDLPALHGSPFLPADLPGVRYEGRTALDALGGVRMGFPGVTAHLRFRGSVLGLRADASNDDSLFDVSVDGGPPFVLRLRRGTGDYVLFRGIPGDHQVALLRRNESWRGTCTLLGYLPGAEGALLEPPALPDRKLLFIGDSVTCGELSAWRPGDDPKDGAHSDAAASYGMILARRLSAQCALVSFGGRGIIRDWQGHPEGSAPEFYRLALPEDPAAVWQPSRYVPDAVGIQLGTNDFNLGAPSQAAFVGAYAELVRQIRRDAPAALVFLMDSPIVTDDKDKGPRRTILHRYLEAVVAALDDPRVILVPLKHYPGVPNNGHPTGSDHLGMAAEIEPVLRKTLGW